MAQQETQGSVSMWADETFGAPSSNMSIGTRANEEMAELLRALAKGKSNDEVATEVADVVIVLYRLADRLGVDLGEAIDRKMRINRARRWNVGADGHGYHVKASAES